MSLLSNLLWLMGIFLIVAITAFFIYTKQRMQVLQAMVTKLRKSLDEMDNQAKLIVRTDMELNKTQEALDKKVAGLYALQRLSRAIITTLDESQIFKRMQAEHIEDLGFEKAVAFLFDKEKNALALHLALGYMDDEIRIIRSSLNSNLGLFTNIIKQEKSISSISPSLDDKILQEIKDMFDVRSFVISPILPKEGNKGLFFAGTERQDAPITEGDEELIIILANQLGQALENARLFEETWQAQQELEKRVEQRTHQLSLALEEVQKINRRKSEFVSNVSHELRTPLTSIKGYASILTSGQLGKIPTEAQQRIEKINQRSDELVQFINDLLDISRIESGRVTMKREPHNLNRIIEEVSDTLSVLMKDKKIDFSVHVPKKEIEVLVDYNQIKRVVINLINNAIKYTPDKGKINVYLHDLGEEAQVDIADTGCGIPEEAQEKLFQEFYRVDTEINQQVKGTGLGLALVKNIIEAHRGKIWVKSKAASGSTFSFTIPKAN